MKKKLDSKLKLLPKPFLVLAPMDDVTDTVFRRVIANTAAPDLYFTEFVNVDGLQSPGRAKLLKKLKFTEQEAPIIAQIWGKDPDNFYKTAREIANGTFAKEVGLKEGINFAGLDLNMGCPDKTAVKHGTCAALINDRELAGQIIKASREGLEQGAKDANLPVLPLSVKTRLGFNQIDLTWVEFLLEFRLNMLSIHGRTRKEMSKVPAHWDSIGETVKLRDKLSPATLIVGNGDVESRQQAEELAQQYNLDGIMIGRGVFHDPYVFAKNSPWSTVSKQERIALYKNHVELFAETWQDRERPIHTLNKFCKIYIQGFDGAKELREKLMQAKSTDELLRLLQE
jgi:tRNA-dihydrouridine synthase